MGSNAYDYLNITMQKISNIVHNSKQSNSITKEDVLDSLTGIVKDYNTVVESEDVIEIDE